MKKSILTFLMLAVVYIASAQMTFEPVTSEGFNVESGTSIDAVFTVDNKEFPVFETESGTKYVKAISKTGKVYAVWVYQATNELYEGRTVFQTRSGKYCIYKLNKNGYPYAVYLRPTE